MRSRTILLIAALAAGTLMTTRAHAQEPPPDAPAPSSEQAAPVAAPSMLRGSTVARIVAPTFARTRLSSPRRGSPVSPQTAWSAQPQTLLVLDSASHDGREWVKVLLAKRPNGSAGWIPRDHVVLGRTRYWIDVRVRARRVTVYRDGKRLRSFRADVGAPKTPTPLGLAAIYERNRQPNPRALGPWVLALTALSNVLKNYDGGPGRTAIHGRSGTSRDPLGSARSHGCIRITNTDVSWMANTLRAGTPVRLRR